MNNKEFTELQLRASICPGLEVDWDPPEYQHWVDLHEAAKELRAVVSHARAGVEAIEKDKDLTADARKRKRHELARQTMAQLDKLPSVEKARASVTAIAAKWQAKIDAVLTKPEADDAATATLFWELRDKFASLKDERARMSWIQKFGTDPLVPSALLLGPASLTNLSDAERALLENKVEALADPRLTSAKSKVTKAMAELERGYRAAPAMVAQSAGLDKAAAALPLPSKPELPKSAPKVTPKIEPPKVAKVTPPAPKVTPPKASPNWPTTNSGLPAPGGQNWT